MITLYDCATAPSPRRARIFLAEKGVAHATVAVDLRSGDGFVQSVHLEDGSRACWPLPKHCATVRPPWPTGPCLAR